MRLKSLKQDVTVTLTPDMVRTLRSLIAHNPDPTTWDDSYKLYDRVMRAVSMQTNALNVFINSQS